MALLHWHAGPRNRGCAYHKRAVMEDLDRNLVVDVFVMPDIAGDRPIAITLGWYRDGVALKKAKGSLQAVSAIAGSSTRIAKGFAALGIDEPRASALGLEVEQMMSSDREEIAKALDSLIPF